MAADDDIDGLMKTMRGDAQTLVRSPSSTVAPPSDGELGRKALEALQRLTHDPRALEDEGPIGEGGMGMVHLARQVSLDRRVAIKFLRPERASTHDVEQLLSEAWTAGKLEHPNILPIHALALNADGKPVIVMKRIEGVTWSALLRDPSAMEAHAPGKVPLDEHLRILTQVCHAVHFAHTRGVVHRDLKPENVMVGAFGEVYVVDWGLACAPGPALQLAGTPAYMAPEMLARGGDLISERTDVYLLGAMLFEVLTGVAPHRGSSLHELFSAVVRSEPSIPTSAPEALASLVRRCLQADASKRPSSALEVRRELESFAERQGSLSLTLQSEHRLTELQTLLSSDAPDATKVYASFSASRFGFEQALATWTGNVRARDGWRSALRTMVTYEAKHGSARTARAFFAELAEANPELQTALDAATAREEEQSRKLQRLEQLETELDPLTGSSIRMATAMIISLIWIVAPWVGAKYAKGTDYEGVNAVPIALLSVAVLGFAMLSRKNEGLRSTPLNRQLIRIVAFGMAAQALGLLAGFLVLGPYPPGIVPMLSGYWAVIAGVGAVSIFPAIWPTAIAYAFSAVASYLDLEHRYEWGTVGNIVFCINALVLWRHQRLQTRHLP